MGIDWLYQSPVSTRSVGHGGDGKLPQLRSTSNPSPCVPTGRAGAVKSCVLQGTGGPGAKFSQYRAPPLPMSSFSHLNVQTFTHLPEDFLVSAVGVKIGVPDQGELLWASLASAFSVSVCRFCKVKSVFGGSCWECAVQSVLRGCIAPLPL